jgi:hypothetical protein
MRRDGVIANEASLLKLNCPGLEIPDTRAACLPQTRIILVAYPPNAT